MVTTKTGACLESDPARNQSGLNLSAHQWWEQTLSLREVPIMKRDAIEENHCLIQ